MEKEFIYTYENKNYPVVVTFKHLQKNIFYRFRKGTFYISSPYFVRQNDYIRGLDKYAGELIKKDLSSEPENILYFLGKRYELPKEGTMTFNEKEVIHFTSKQDLINKLKPIYLSLITQRVNYYSELMDIPLYKVKTKDMDSRFGSNSKRTNTVCFSNTLMHYSLEIIDSVVVHELCHVLVFNHSQKFYDEVYKYCPHYKICRKKLIKRIYQ